MVRSPDTYSPISSQAPVRRRPRRRRRSPPRRTRPTATMPADLHFSPADITYLNSLDPAARDAAIHRQRENLQALKAAAKLTNGYTDSLKNWSIKGATARHEVIAGVRLPSRAGAHPIHHSDGNTMDTTNWVTILNSIVKNLLTGTRPCSCLSAPLSPAASQ